MKNVNLSFLFVFQKPFTARFSAISTYRIIHKSCTPIFELAGNPVFSDHPEMHRMCVAVTSLNKIYFKFLVFNLLIKATILGGQNHKAVKCPRID